MKRERLTPRDIVILGSVILLAVCCICVGTLLTAVEDIGSILTAPLRWLGDVFGFAEPGLRQALEDRSASSFTLGEGCTFPYTSGSLVRTQAATNTDPLSSTLPRQEVIDHFQDYFVNKRFIVENGEIRLSSGTPITLSQLTRESFYLSLIDEQAAADARTTTSMEGVVDDNLLSGSYYVSATTSTVSEGRGIEEAQTITADFDCPIWWEVE